MSEELIARIEAELTGGPGSESGGERYVRATFEATALEDLITELVRRSGCLVPCTREDALTGWRNEDDMTEFLAEAKLIDEQYFEVTHPLAERLAGSPEHFHLLVAKVAPDTFVAVGPQTRRRAQLGSADPGETPEPPPWSDEVFDTIDNLVGSLPGGPWSWQTAYTVADGRGLLVADTSFDAVVRRFLLSCHHLAVRACDEEGPFQDVPLLLELQRALADSHVLALGSWANYQIYVVGRGPDGRWVGVETTTTWS